jgi:uncharacterized lipoprotein YehR (DUF1307 family)
MMLRLRQSLIRYLNNTFPIVKIINFDTIKIPEKMNDNFHIYKDNNKYYFDYYNLSNIPSLNLLRYIDKLDSEFKIKSNKIPLRWYYILQDFYIPDLQFEIEPIDYTDKVNQLTDIVIENIIKDATQITTKYILKVNDDRWITRDLVCRDKNELVKTFFENSKKYKSLNGEYRYLAAVEGGIKFNNSYVDDYVDLNHSQLGIGSIRNECKGHDSYLTGKDITVEELLVLHLIMNAEGIKNSFGRLF